MKQNSFSGQYLAPEVKVMEVQLRQSVLTGSPSNVNNPFNGGSEQEW